MTDPHEPKKTPEFDDTKGEPGDSTAGADVYDAPDPKSDIVDDVEKE